MHLWGRVKPQNMHADLPHNIQKASYELFDRKHGGESSSSGANLDNIH